MTLIEKIMIIVLFAAVIAVGCLAASLTHVSGSLTLTFGKQPVNQIAVALSEMRVAR